MKYTVKLEKGARKTLEKLDKPTRNLILGWLARNLEGCENPRDWGKSLKGSYSGMWRYRIGDWRVLAQIVDEEVQILIIKIGHRREIYRDKS